MAALLFLGFLIIPLIEVGIFIQIGGFLGLWWTLGLIVATAVVGSFIIRLQGFGVLNNARASLARAEVPVEPMIHGLFLIVAGLLLITPGFFTDTMGFLLLIPPVRLLLGRALFRRLAASGQVHMSGYAARDGDRSHAEGIVIEGEAEEIEDPGSPWARR